MRRVSTGTYVFLGIFVLVLVGGCTVADQAIDRVEVGNVGLRIHLTESDGQGNPVIDTLTPGWNFKNPFTEQIVEYPTSQRTLVLDREDAPTCLSQGGSFQWDASIEFRIDPAQAKSLYLKRRGVPLDGDSSNSLAGLMVRPAVTNAMGTVCGQLGFSDVLGAKRTEAQGRMFELVKSNLEPDGFRVETFLLRDPHLNADQKKAIDANLLRQQEASAAFFLAEKARNEAAALEAKAQGEADAQLIKARAEAESNRLLRESLTPEIVRLREIEKWNGVYPPGGQTITDLRGTAAATSPAR